ncbi:hypothetical protein AAG906_038458 [Vitis piasezkii]
MSTFSGDKIAPFFVFLDADVALVFSCMGAAYGIAKSRVGVVSMGVMRFELVVKSIVLVVIAGVLGMYGLIIAVIISTDGNGASKSFTRTSKISSSRDFLNLIQYFSSILGFLKLILDSKILKNIPF